MHRFNGTSWGEPPSAMQNPVAAVSDRRNRWQRGPEVEGRRYSNRVLQEPPLKKAAILIMAAGRLKAVQQTRSHGRLRRLLYRL
jgi:hypothetical protein